MAEPSQPSPSAPQPRFMAPTQSTILRIGSLHIQPPGRKNSSEQPFVFKSSPAKSPLAAPRRHCNPKNGPGARGRGGRGLRPAGNPGSWNWKEMALSQGKKHCSRASPAKSTRESDPKADISDQLQAQVNSLCDGLSSMHNELVSLFRGAEPTEDLVKLLQLETISCRQRIERARHDVQSDGSQAPRSPPPPVICGPGEEDDFVGGEVYDMSGDEEEAEDDHRFTIADSPPKGVLAVRNGEISFTPKGMKQRGGGLFTHL